MTDDQIWQSIIMLVLEFGKNLVLIIGVLLVGVLVFANALTLLGWLIDKWSEEDETKQN